MAETATRNYPLPDSDDRPNVPYDIKRLADAIDADVADLTFDTGWRDMELFGGFIPNGNGARYRRKSNVVYWQINADADAHPVGLLHIFTMPATFRPKYLHTGTSYRVEEESREIVINPDGRVRVTNQFQSVFGLQASGSYPID